MSSIPWTPREFAKSSQAPGYRDFWAKGSKWEKFLLPIGLSLPASIELAKENNVNQHLTESPAVYEFALVHPARPDSRIKVYVGKAVNLKQRHNQYLSLPTSADPDANLARHFACALEHGCEVWRRYRYVEQAVYDNKQHGLGDRHAQMMETRMLGAFDYAFNQQANPPKRMIWLEPRTTCCCFSAGVIVHNVDPLDMGRGRQFPAAHKAGTSCLF
ncbi:hypothetical protein D9Q98_001366 [Chlorella vulgaris]|uniref:GIY-YIG domain-containing protein n=1 Tax=Chlorella vulgaris TaxID=3077 RepID=A0A9D4Z336_CHLVU|nr:hypothetical protein D9Q98_001366 [Chlorella vulgaris]